MTPDQKMETDILEGRLDITIQSIQVEVDHVFERRLNRYGSYSLDQIAAEGMKIQNEKEIM